jgi:hypothetical protein
MNKDKAKLTVLRECRPTLKEAQDLIGGYVEMIEGKEGFQLLMDEDGRDKYLPINLNASAMAGRTIVGNVIALFGDARWVD